MGKTILVVDNEAGALRLVAMMLGRSGYEVLEAKNTHEADEILSQLTPNLVMLDVMMPGLSGIDYCRIIREREETRYVPVLMLSAFGDPETKVRAREAGANDFLEKPILHNDIVARIKAEIGDP